MIGPATNVAKTVCCWIVPAGTLTIVQPASTGQGEIEEVEVEEHS